MAAVILFYCLFGLQHPPILKTEKPIEPPISAPVVKYRAVAISDDNSLAVGVGAGGKISAYSLKDQKLLYHVRTPGGLELERTTFLPNSHTIVASGNRQILYWDVDKKGVVDRIKLPKQPFESAISPNRKWLACANYKAGKELITVYDLEAKKVHSTFYISRPIWHLTWTSDLQSLLIGILPGGKVLQYEPKTKQEIILDGAARAARTGGVKVYTDPYSDLACWGKENRQIYFFDMKTKKKLAQITYPDGIEINVRFAPNQAIFAMVGADGVVHLYDRKTFRYLGKSKKIHEDVIWDVQFSRDSNFIVTGGHDGKMNILRVDEILGREK